QGVTTPEDTAVGITLSGSDPEGSPLTFAVVSGPSHGTLSGTAPNLTYTPAANYAGSDSFTFRVNDGSLNSATATVAITVTAVNDPPTGSPTAIVVDQGGSLSITLVASDPDGNPLTYQVTVAPAHGTLSGTGPTYVYTPSPGFTGQDSLAFTVSDGTATSAPVVVVFNAPAPVAAGGGGGGGGGCGLLGVETLLLLGLVRRRR
ncbi:MAG TPA: Ig-like domain-containing protein, partial [Planctomycetota bacterium]|nr:Ig-like domain-containing protein [Planctomycetota bacterium]